MALKLSKDFFESLNHDCIRYCHWKSNIRLQKALSGRTDLDILIHRDDKERFEESLKKFGFKQILSPSEKQYPGLEDYLGFDYDTGSLIHLHVHYNLILGQRYIKNHHLPIEEMVLRNLTTRNNVFIPIPELELLILIIRAHMKIDIISLLKQAVKDLSRSPYTPFPEHIEKELDELISKSDAKRLIDLLRQTGLPIPEDLFKGFISRFASRELNCIGVLRDCFRIFSALKMFRRRTSLSMYLGYAYRAIWDLPVISRFRPSRKKTLPGWGRIYAFVGADGSGKSTLVNDLDQWLSWKLSVRRYYFGIPKNKMIQIVSEVIYVFKKLRLERISSMMESWLWIAIARHRQALSMHTHEAAAQGDIVISDRYPLKEFHHMDEPMDGPRLMNRSTWLDSLLAALEISYYNRILPPDRIFILKVDLDEVRLRKNDLDLDTHRAKVEAVNSLDKGNSVFAIIDANQPYQAVQMQVKRMIWEDL